MISGPAITARSKTRARQLVADEAFDSGSFDVFSFQVGDTEATTITVWAGSRSAGISARPLAGGPIAGPR